MRRGWLAVLALCAVGLVPATASASIINVGAGCSLASAIIAANIDQPFGGCLSGFGRDEIRIPAGLSIPLVLVDHTAPGGSGPTGLPAITSDITIRATGSTDVATISRVDVAPDFRIFQIEAGGSLTLQRIVVRGGRLSGTSADDLGGCLEARSGSGPLLLDETTFESCSAYGEATAIFSRASETRIDQTTVLASRALGPAGATGSAVQVRGVGDVTNSTFSDNEGASYVQVGGLGTLTHCSVIGGGLGPARVESTLSATLQLRNTLVQGSTATETAGMVVLEGTNLIDPSIMVDGLLANGGLTLTHLPMNGGPAIDVADMAYCLTVDQRRMMRPQGIGCDVGAVELAAPVIMTCGNGELDPGETCDDGMETATCDADCTPAVCGDGTFNAAAGEECDDGTAGARCTADCMRVVCGDRVVTAAAGEQCDDGGETSTCDADCTILECGDRVINETAGEECDDGNDLDNDGCSRRCRLEADAGPRPDAGPRILRDAGEVDPDGGVGVEFSGCAVRPNGSSAPWLLALVLGLLARRRRR